MWAFRSAAELKDSRTRGRSDPDGNPGPVIAGRKGAAAASITEAVLRREVLRDLEQLLNAVSLESTDRTITAFPFARRSILNFGLPDLSRRTIDEISGNDRAVERDIETALRTYEPRLAAGTIRVKRDASVDPTSLKVRYQIQADLVCRPVDIPVEFTADVDAASGRVAVSSA